MNQAEIYRNAVKCVCLANRIMEDTEGHPIDMVSAAVALSAIGDYKSNRTIVGEFAPMEVLALCDRRIKLAEDYFDSRFEEAI